MSTMQPSVYVASIRQCAQNLQSTTQQSQGCIVEQTVLLRSLGRRFDAKYKEGCCAWTTRKAPMKWVALLSTVSYRVDARSCRVEF